VREGESIAQPLKRSGQFPPIVTHMIAVPQLHRVFASATNAHQAVTTPQRRWMARMVTIW